MERLNWESRCDWWTVVPRPAVRMHMGVSLETCSLVPLTTSWTNACPSVGGSNQRNPVQSSGERKTDGWRGMYGAWGRRLGETVTEHYGAQDRESFVTVASSDPDLEQDLTLTSWNLLDCLKRETAVFLYLTLKVEALPLRQHSSVSRRTNESLCSCCWKALYLQDDL